MEELESYAKQAEEFHTFGDLQDVQRYLKKAQVLNGKLDAAADKVQLRSPEGGTGQWGSSEFVLSILS